MSKVIERWLEQNKREGLYAAYEGFEKEMCEYGNLTDMIEASLVCRANLFAFVCNLLDEEHELMGGQCSLDTVKKESDPLKDLAEMKIDPIDTAPENSGSNRA